MLDGIISENVRIAGILSRRPNIWPRRMATERSIAKLGLSGYFDEASQIRLTGSETAKGQALVDESEYGPVGMLEDKPHRLVPVIIDALDQTSSDSGNHAVTLGVVPHSRADEYLARMIEATKEMGAEFTEEAPNVFRLYHDPRLTVVTMNAYDETEGKRFAQLIRSSES